MSITYILQYPQFYAILLEISHPFHFMESEEAMKSSIANQKKSRLVEWGAFVCVALLALASFAGCGDPSIHAAETVLNERISVNTIQPVMGDIIVTGEYIGTLEPGSQVAVLPMLPGEVLAVYFSIGESVQAGDVLFRIDSSDIETSIAALEAQLAVQEAMIRAAETGVVLAGGSALQSQIVSAAGGVNQAAAAIAQAEQNIEQARIGIEQAQMAYDLALQGKNDAEVLFAAGAMSRSSLDQAEAGYLNARAGLERAISGLALAEIGLNTATQAHSQALEGQRIITNQAPGENRRRAADALEQARAAYNAVLVNIETAIDRLDDAVVTSPISGVVQMRNVEQFSFAAPGNLAFLIAEQENLTVMFRVPRSSVEFLGIGDEITLLDNGIEHAGTISEISSMVEPGGLLTVRARVPNYNSNLMAGTSVRVFADAQRAEGVITLPLGAVRHERGVPFVFIADGGIARRVQVETGLFNQEIIQIVSGISVNDRIITTWNPGLADGTEIEVL